MRHVLCALFLLTIPACKKESALKDTTDTKFRVGQRWNYWARPGEETSTFTIEKIESHPTMGEIVHIGLDNLKLTMNKKTVGIVPHLAFSRDAIDKSAAKKVEDDGNLPPFQQDYDKWKKGVDEGTTTTVINSTIADQLSSMEDK